MNSIIMIYVTTIIKFLFFGITIFISKFLFDYVYLKYRFRKVPSKAGLPFIGIAWDLLRMPNEDHMEYFTKLTKEFNGNVYIMWMGIRPLINIQKPNHMEALLSSTVNIKKSSIYNMLTPWLGDGLLTSTGKKWLHQRRLLTPAFHFGVLEQFSEIIFDKADILNNCLKKYISENANQAVDIFAFASKFTLDVICNTAMGIDMDTQQDSTNTYSNALHEFAILVMDRFSRPWYMSDFIYSKTKDGKKFKAAIKLMHDFSLKIINEKLDKKRKLDLCTDENIGDKFGKRKRKAFLDILLEASVNDEHAWSVDQIRQEVDTFMFAGHDTTAVALSWTLFALGNELDIQENVNRELQTIFGHDINKRARTADLTQLKYLDRVIKESLRLYPSVPIVFRDLSEEVVFDGHKFPEGSSVIINIYDLHRDPEAWENPTDFKPDRFLPEQLKGRHPYAYAPFSAGPRNCIGQKFALLELKIALVAILRKWRIKSMKSPTEIKMQSDLILRCCEPIQLQLIPIH